LDRNAFKTPDAVDLDRIANLDRSGKVGITIVGNGHGERAWLSGFALCRTGFCDCDVRAALITSLAKRIDNVVSGGRAIGTAGTVLEALIAAHLYRHIKMTAGARGHHRAGNLAREVGSRNGGA
jgi:hypothetical protein